MNYSHLIVAALLAAFFFGNINTAQAQSLGDQIRLRAPSEVPPGGRREQETSSSRSRELEDENNDTKNSPSLNPFAGKTWFANITLAGGTYDTLSTPDTRDGGGPYGTLLARAEWEIWRGEQNKSTGRRWQQFLGPAIILNAFEYSERNWRGRGGLGGIGLSWTLTHADGYVNSRKENFGSMYLNASAMFAYSRQWGETKYDNYELEKDEAFGLRLEVDWQFFAARILTSKTAYRVGRSGHVYGVTGFLTNIQLTAFGFIPFADDRKDSLPGFDAEGPDQINGTFRARVELFTFDFPIFGTRGQMSFTGGGSLRYQERIRRGNDFDGVWDKGLEAGVKFIFSDNIYAGAFYEVIWRDNNFNANNPSQSGDDELAHSIGVYLSYTFN